MTHTIFIDGAAGTTGLEIQSRLAGRSEFPLLTLDEARRKDTAARREALNEADMGYETRWKAKYQSQRVA